MTAVESAITPRGLQRVRDWVLALALASPAWIPLIAHHVASHSAGLVATGALRYDMPYYFANARELFDDGSFHLMYANPFSPYYDSPRIYFQPLTVVLGLVARVTGAGPHALLVAFAIVAALVFARVAIALFDRFASRATRAGQLSIVSFFWGGGLLVIVGSLLSIAVEGQPRHPFVLDPEEGWWFLNMGRNLIYPTESVTHALFFLCILSLLSRRFAWATAWAAILSVSHPFTGLQLLLIMLSWSALEFVVARSRRQQSVVRPPLWFPAACLGLLAVHVGYYLVFLNRFPEHRQLQQQWLLPWVLPVSTLVPAYALVAFLVYRRLRASGSPAEVFADWKNRLLFAWFAVSLALANHDLFMRPVQPLHFTRGYIWTPLFLLGVPALIRLFQNCLGYSRPLRRASAAAGLLLLLVFDNAAWLLNLSRPREATRDALAADQAGVLRFLARPADRRALVISDDNRIGYMATVYTPLRSWRSHTHNTPWSAQRLAELREFFDHGVVVPEWRRRPLYVVFRAGAPWRERLASFAPAAAASSFENASYVVQYIPAVPVASDSTAR